jgi:hypothetical protein
MSCLEGNVFDSRFLPLKMLQMYQYTIDYEPPRISGYDILTPRRICTAAGYVAAERDIQSR